MRSISWGKKNDSYGEVQYTCRKRGSRETKAGGAGEGREPGRYHEKNIKLIGTWEAAQGQILEIQTERLSFNYRAFDYTVEGGVLIIEEVYPGNSISGKVPFKLKGDTLTIDLGDLVSGIFYGRSGMVELERADTDE